MDLPPAAARPDLRLQRQPADREDMGLRHGRLAARADIGDEVAEIGQWLLRGVDMAGAGLVDQEDMVGARPAGDIDIFAQLDRAFGAQDSEPPVAPGRQAVGGEPVDADIAAGLRAAQQDLAEILEIGQVGAPKWPVPEATISASCEPVKCRNWSI
jgi:hypothetical protein